MEHGEYLPDFPIPPDSANIHGFTTERAKAEGVSLCSVLPQFNADVERSTTVIAHNLDFDLPSVATEFLRCGLDTRLLRKQTFCTMKAPHDREFFHRDHDPDQKYDPDHSNLEFYFFIQTLMKNVSADPGEKISTAP